MGNVNMEASQINYRGGQKKMSVEEALKNTSGEAAAIAQLQTDVLNLNSNKANQITIAPFFNAETAYTAGDLVYYNGLSYRCTNDHEGAWDADDFAVTTIANELDTLKSGLISDNYTIGYTVKNMLSYPYSETTKTVNDVTFTAADDGKIAVNGTASARATFLIKDATSNFALPSGSYILTKGLVQPGFGITVEAYNGNSWVKLLAISAGADAANFTVDYVGYDRLVITAYVDNGIEVTNKTLLPMIRLSSVQDATWEAYRQTVAESLTNLIVMEEVELAFTGTVTLNTYSYITLENIAKAGYKIVSLQPRLVSPAEYLNINTMVVGSMDEQIIAKCNYANSTGSYTDPVFYLKIIYLKITN